MTTDKKPTILIHAGGENTRFFPLNTETHKGFLSLHGKPIVVQALENLQKHGFTKVVLIASKKDMYGNGLSAVLPHYSLSLEITWVLQPEAQGQGHALLVAADYIDDSFISMSPYYTNAGALADSLYKAHQQHASECVLMGTKVKNPSLYGILQFAPDNPQRVTGIVEKPKKDIPSDYKVNSVYLLSKAFLEYLKTVPVEEYSLETALTKYIQDHSVTWIENTLLLPSLKYPWHLFDMQKYLFKGTQTSIHPTATIAQTASIDDTHGPVIIESGARVSEYAKLVGPCYIGTNVLIGEYCFIRGGCSIEAEATVGSNTEVVRSIILTGASIHFGYIADSILGQHVQVGAGLITANKRFDRTTIKTQVKEEMISMKRNAHGVIVGAHTHLGIGIRTMPGVLIGAHNKVNPALVISKNIPHKNKATKSNN